MLLTLVTAALLGGLDSPVTERAASLAAQAVQNSQDIRSAAALIRLHQLEDELDDLNILADTAYTLLYRRRTDPLVRSLAHHVLADVERARGRTVKAREQLDALGLVRAFHVVGGFENEGKRGCDTDWGPESRLELDAAYPAAGGRTVGFRRLTTTAGDGSVDLGAILRPSSESVAYALTFLRAESEVRAQLSVGASGAVRLFVNGVRVASADRYNHARPDQLRVEVRLRRGLNRVLLKVCTDTAPAAFFLAATTGEGPLPVELPETLPPLERGPSPAPVLLPTLASALEKRVKAAPSNAALRADLATVLSATRAFDVTDRSDEVEAVRAALQEPGSAELALLAAGTVDELNERRRWLDQALRVDPAHPFARLELARLELDAEHPERALALASGLLAQLPAMGAAHVVRVDALEALGERVAAVRAAEAAYAELPVLPRVAREAVSAARRAEHHRDALERAHAAVALRFDDLGTRQVLASMLTELGRVDEAAEAYRKLLALDPFNLSVMLTLADLLAANGRRDEAWTVYASARAMSPDDPQPAEREGRARLFAGETAPAIAAFRRSLALKPQNPALRELLRSLDGEGLARSDEEAFRLADLDTGLASTGEDAVTLARVTHVRVAASGQASRFQQLVVKVFTRRGVEAFRSVSTQWSPDREEVRVLRARVLKPDGSVVEAVSEQDTPLNEPWAGMYYDARARVLTFPALAEGDVVEVMWRIDDVARDNLLSDSWGDVDQVASDTATRRYRYVVDMPAGRPLHFDRARLPAGVEATVTEEDRRTVYRFEARDVPRVVAEPNMPPLSEVAPPLHLSTFGSWAEVSRFYAGLVRDQLVPSAELRRTVDAALTGVDRSRPDAVVGALYGWVVKNTRYVALEFGIHGFKPYPVDRVLARRFGDCKDKASLLVAMLGVAGVDASLVLLRMRHLGVLPGDVASLAAFNHAIVYVPALDLFLDGTAEHHGTRELPIADRRASALVVRADGTGRFLTIPEAPADDNLTHLELDVALKPDGSAAVKGSLTVEGQSAPEVRQTFHTPATRLATFEQQWSQAFPGVRAREVSVSDVTDLERPSVLTFSMDVPRYAESGAATLRFFPFGASRTFAQALAPLAERRYDALFSGAWVNRLHVTYHLPPGWLGPEDAVDVSVPSGFGALTMTVRSGPGTVTVDGTLTLATAAVKASDYPAFRAWLVQVDQAFGTKVVVRRGATTAAR